MKENRKTIVYEGLGFPIKLINVPMRKLCGEWVMDIDMNKLQLFIFEQLIHKHSRLNGSEIKFMRKYLEISTTELGKKLGITHAAVLKWEKDQSKMSPALEVYLRMFFLEVLRNRDVLKIFEEIKPENLLDLSEEKQFSIDMKEIGFVA